MASETAPKLQAKVREADGTSSAKKLRQQGLVPAVCYGFGIDNHSIALEPTEFDKIVETTHGLNTVVDIELDNGETLENLLLRDYQVEPIKRTLLHADFVAVNPEESIEVRVPIEPEGEAEGVKIGGRLQFIHREVEVKAPPTDIPEAIPVDVTELTPDDAIMADDLDYPEEIEPTHKVDFAVLRIQMPREEMVVGEAPATTAATTPTTEEELEEGEEAVEGEEAEEEEGPGAGAQAPGA